MDSEPRLYSLSFTAASLRPELVTVMADLFEECRSWDKVRDRALATNALQCRSSASAIRLERELRHRLQTLTDQQLDLIGRATSDGRTCLAWLAAVKRSAFLFDFASETLRAKLRAHDPVLRHSDYEGFVGEKASLHPELASLTKSSLGKIRRVLFRMLREVGILEKGEDHGRIQRPLLPPDVADVICADDPGWLAAFLVPDDEIRARHPRNT